MIQGEDFVKLYCIVNGTKGKPEDILAQAIEYDKMLVDNNIYDERCQITPNDFHHDLLDISGHLETIEGLL